MRHQDRGRWDRLLVGEGFRFLEESASGSEVSHMHLEAGIAALHCAAETYERINWKEIVRLYDHLMTIRPTPIVALNRAIAIGERDGAEAGLAAIRAISTLNRSRRITCCPRRSANAPAARTAPGSQEILRAGLRAHLFARRTAAPAAEDAECVYFVDAPV
jgi:RNA polymerase sigma-70 factor (ECF subfamily)